MTSRRAFVEIKCEDTQSCSVPNCESIVDNEEGILFFSIPNNRSTAWLNAIHRTDLIGTDLSSTFVCSTHFVLDDIVYESGVLSLKPGTRPTQLLPNCGNASPITSTSLIKQENFSDTTEILPPETVTGDMHVYPKIYNVFSQASMETILPPSTDETTTTPSTSQDKGVCAVPAITVQNGRVQATPGFTNLTNAATQLTTQISEPAILTKSGPSSKATKRKRRNLIGDNDKFTQTLPSIERAGEISKALLEMKVFLYRNSFALTLNRKYAYLKHYFSHPEIYRLISRDVCLVSVAKLSHFVKPETNTLNDKLFAVLKSKIDTMTTKQKVCSLCVSITRLRAHLHYNITQDNVCGFEEIGGVRNNVKAKFAYTVFARGIFSDWSQPIAYCFVENPSKTYCSPWLLTIISNLLNIGLKVQCVTCDLSDEFINDIKTFQLSPERPFLLLLLKNNLCVAHHRVCFGFDYRKIIIKALECLMHVHIEYGNGNVASWVWVIQYHQIDRVRQIPCSPQLDDLLTENGENKLQLKYALTVFNLKLARTMSTYIKLGLLPEQAQSTVEFIIMVRKLYNFFAYKQYKTSVSQSALLDDDVLLKDILDVYTFLRSINDKSSALLSMFVLSSKITVRSMLQLFSDLNVYRIPKYPLRRLNLDCIDFFNDELSKVIKGHVDATAWQYRTCFRNLFSRFLMRPLNIQRKCMPIDEFLKQIHISVNSPESPFDVVSCYKNSSRSMVKMRDYSNIKIPTDTVDYISGFLLYKCYSIHKTCNDLKNYIYMNCLFVKDAKLPRHRKWYKMPQRLVKSFVGKPLKASTQGCIRAVLVVPPVSLKLYVVEMEKTFTSLYRGEQLLPSTTGLVNDFLEKSNAFFKEAPCHCFPRFYMNLLYFRMRLRLALVKTNKELGNQQHQPN